MDQGKVQWGEPADCGGEKPREERRTRVHQGDQRKKEDSRGFIKRRTQGDEEIPIEGGIERSNRGPLRPGGKATKTVKQVSIKAKREPSGSQKNGKKGKGEAQLDEIGGGHLGGENKKKRL